MSNNNWGTSHQVYSANGRPLSAQDRQSTFEVCGACQDSPQGETNFVVMWKDEQCVNMVCPSCGEIKNAFINEVRLGPELKRVEE